MPHDPIKAYCESVCAMIRWKPYHPRVTAELTEHMTDHADHLIAKGADETQAKKDAATAMGDPYAIGKNLDALHSPWYPRLSHVFTVLALIALFFTVVVIQNGGLANYRYAPLSNPHQLLENTISAPHSRRGRGHGRRKNRPLHLLTIRRSRHLPIHA